MEKSVVQIQIRENREDFLQGNRMTVSYRRMLLRKLRENLRKNRAAILAALHADLHRSEEDSLLSEYLPMMAALKYFISNLKSLTRPKRVPVSLWNFPATGKLYPEPYGEVLIFSTWNYPLLLALEPLAGAIAAGNKVVLKLSDQAGKTAALLAWLLRETFPETDVIVPGGELSTDELLNERFDYIFFTGGQRAGRHVMIRGAENLTPATMELGGKNPCIVDEDANLSVAAKRIAWGKFLNAGQTCLAPDYLLVHRKVKDDFLVELRKRIRQLYGDNPVESVDYSRIVNSEEYQRLGELLAEGRLICGGDKNPDRLSIAPTVIDGITPDSPIMREEIFGPILPVLDYLSEGDLMQTIKSHGKPLALYYFGKRSEWKKKLCSMTSSGSVCINDVIMQVVNPGMPFGGVGESGFGAYHGKYTFDTFTHYKPVMEQSSWLDWPLRYPPFSGICRKIIQFLSR